jgi:hypothetical protein
VNVLLLNLALDERWPAPAVAASERSESSRSGGGGAPPH